MDKKMKIQLRAIYSMMLSKKRIGKYIDTPEYRLDYCKRYIARIVKLDAAHRRMYG